MSQGGRAPTRRGRLYGKNIRGCRKTHLGITQAEFAKRLDVAQSTVNRWEMGISLPPDDRKVEIARLCKLPVDTLFPRVVE